MEIYKLIEELVNLGFEVRVSQCGLDVKHKHMKDSVYYLIDHELLCLAEIISDCFERVEVEG